MDEEAKHSTSSSSSSSSSEGLEERCACVSAEGAISLLLRLSMGMLFFIAGLNKFVGQGGASGAAQWIIGEFKETYLPLFLVVPYAYVLPYFEILLGAALILGIFTRAALLVCGLLLISLALGNAVTHDYATVANNLNYVLITAVALWFASRDNPYSLDGLLERK